MTTADATIELHLFLWTIAIVFVANVGLGALRPGARSILLSLLQATAFTGVGFLATIRPHEVDGQTGVGIPLMWFPYFVASLSGLSAARLLRRASTNGS